MIFNPVQVEGYRSRGTVDGNIGMGNVTIDFRLEQYVMSYDHEIRGSFKEIGRARKCILTIGMRQLKLRRQTIVILLESR